MNIGVIFVDFLHAVQSDVVAQLRVCKKIPYLFSKIIQRIETHQMLTILWQFVAIRGHNT